MEVFYLDFEQKNFIIKEVPIPNIERAGGLKSSKFGRSPKMWFRIFKMILHYKLGKDIVFNK